MRVKTANLENLSVMMTDEIVISSQRNGGEMNVLLYNPKRNKFRRAGWAYAGTVSIKSVLPAIKVTYISPIDGDPTMVPHIGPNAAASLLSTSGYRYNSSKICDVVSIEPSSPLTTEMVTENGQFGTE